MSNFIGHSGRLSNPNLYAQQVENAKYKKKYKRLKKLIKNYVFENAALCDQIADIQETISIIRDERSFLLKKLMDYEDAEIQLLNTVIPTNLIGQNSSVPGKRGPKKRINLDNSTNKANLPNTIKPASSSAPSAPAVSSVATASSIPTATSVAVAPSASLTLSTSMSQQNQQPTFTTDAQGCPIYPMSLDNILVHSVGEVVPENPNFHNENWIYPVGYTSTRIYAHPREPDRKCTFTCKILNNSGMPQFQIIPDSDYDHVFFGESGNICHLNLLESIVHSADIKNMPIRAQGEVFFGLGHKTIQTIIRSLPNFNKCQNFKRFLPEIRDEEKDPTLNFDALQKLMTISVYHTVPEIKAEPPDELLE